MVLFLAAAAIVIGAVAAALGRAGEMARFRGDFRLLDPGEVTAAEVALLRPPLSVWGYNAVMTEEALQAIARAVGERDAQIAELRAELADLRGGRPIGPGGGHDG